LHLNLITLAAHRVQWTAGLLNLKSVLDLPPNIKTLNDWIDAAKKPYPAAQPADPIYTGED
jgi:hypothetical protein